MSAPAVEVGVRYAAVEDVEPVGDALRVALPLDGNRPCSLTADLKRPGIIRDALLTMSEILTHDLRRKPRSRADYLAYLLASGKRVTQEVWNAQRAFLQAQYGEATAEEAGLDPLLVVDDSGVAIEVFSADESAYARLHLRAGEALEVREADHGTSHIDLASPAVRRVIRRVRSYRRTELVLASAEHGEERRYRVPHRWTRAFGQVQAASTLPATTFTLDPVDLYNVLLTLRMQRARKAPRALRYELVPGEQPRIVLEPWERVIASIGPAYAGAMPLVVRTWGRRRLAVLARLLPHTRAIHVHLVGAGLPAYYVFDLGDASLTLALSGWTESGWAGIATFDLLAAGPLDEILAQRVLERLRAQPCSLDDLARDLQQDRTVIRQAVLHHMQRGLVVHDLAQGHLIHRPLLIAPPSAEALRYRDRREEDAHRLLAIEGAVMLTRVHDLGAEGTRIEGVVEDAKAHRSYKTSFTLDREGRTVDASCTSPQFRRSGLREGPTVPMIALRLLYGRQRVELERQRNTEAGRKRIVAETRTLTRRRRGEVMTYRVSLDGREVATRWGVRPDTMRQQRMFFTSTDDAREAYFGRLDSLSRRGFIDASMAEAP